MAYQDITFSSSDGVAIITFDRPQVLNALSPLLISEWLAIMQKLQTDLSIKVLIVKGNGRAWSAGVDLQALNAGIQDGQFAADQILIDGCEVIRLLQSSSFVTIASVNGFCFTGATELMMAFDLVYAADEAKIGDTHAKWGIAPKWGMTQRLPQRVGFQKAMEMSFTCVPVSGIEAEQIGLVNKSVPLDKLDAYVDNIAVQIASNSAQTVAAMKKLYYQGMHTTLSEGLSIEYQADINITDRGEFLKSFKANK
jgi:enoyl-CoA hydratase/carnithine racemase